MIAPLSFSAQDKSACSQIRFDDFFDKNAQPTMVKNSDQDDKRSFGIKEVEALLWKKLADTGFYRNDLEKVLTGFGKIIWVPFGVIDLGLNEKDEVTDVHQVARFIVDEIEKFGFGDKNGRVTKKEYQNASAC